MKTCSACNQEKPETDFGPDKRAKDSLRQKCKACRKIVYDTWFFEKGGKEKRTNLIKIAHDYVYELLQQSKCVDCDETRWQVLEFDHVRGDKQCAIAKMIHNGYSLETIKTEIAKCEVRCANCHRLKTYRDGGFRGLLSDNLR